MARKELEKIVRKEGGNEGFKSFASSPLTLYGILGTSDSACFTAFTLISRKRSVSETHALTKMPRKRMNGHALRDVTE